jgi:APA family basic amino acid/polyamine antiporter
MKDLPETTWIRFVVWLVIGLVIYGTYGYKHSRVRQAQRSRV